jgi:hypothetical protein
MANATLESRSSSNPFHELVEALADRHGEIELRLEHVTLRFPMIPEAIELNGDVSLSVHLRHLSEDEKSAITAKEVRRRSK